jgi:protease-4
VEVAGVIADDPLRDDLLAEVAEAENVRAMILRVNSPGGTTAGSEALYEAIRAVAAEKPVVAVMGEVAASGGYVAAIAADHVIGRGNTLTGSIGVIFEYPDFTELMARLGVDLETVRSSELKAEPSPFRETTPAARAVEAALVADGYAWFRGLVDRAPRARGRGARRGGERRGLHRAARAGARLIDAIGGEREALAWLESRDAALGGLPVRDLGSRIRDRARGPGPRADHGKRRILREISLLGGRSCIPSGPESCHYGRAAGQTAASR